MIKDWDPLNLSIGSVIFSDAKVTNLDFHRDGKMLVVASASTLQVVDCLSGVETKRLYCKTYGLGVVRYTHHESCILCSSEKKSNDIRYLCMSDNRYLRFFKGHTDKVTSMQMSPVDDCFLSVSRDRTMLLWDLSSPNCLAKLQLPLDTINPCVAYEQGGVIFGVMSRTTHLLRNSVKLYDARNYTTGPFLDIAPPKNAVEIALSRVITNMAPLQISRLADTPWSSVEFSPDGRHVLVNTGSTFALVLDSYANSEIPVVIHAPQERESPSTSSPANQSDPVLILSSCFSADGKYVICGTSNNMILVFTKDRGELVNTLAGHVSAVHLVFSNPVYDVIASSCINTAIWTSAQANEVMESKLYW